MQSLSGEARANFPRHAGSEQAGRISADPGKSIGGTDDDRKGACRGQTKAAASAAKEIDRATEARMARTVSVWEAGDREIAAHGRRGSGDVRRGTTTAKGEGRIILPHAVLFLLSAHRETLYVFLLAACLLCAK